MAGKFTVKGTSSGLKSTSAPKMPGMKKSAGGYGKKGK